MAIDWLELRTKYYAIIYPAEYEMLARTMVASYGEALDAEYERFAEVFNFELQPPVSVRVYPTIYDFQTLNPVTPRILPTTTHSHIGYREIALIGENILADPEWAFVAVNHIRYELAILFVQKITDLHALPGLLAGVGRYAQDPALGNEIGEAVKAAAGAESAHVWLLALENDSVFVDAQIQVEAVSMVSLLVEQFSWPVFVEFLSTLAISGSPEQALQTTYSLSGAEFQNLWNAYYPQYLASRWKYSIFYSYDLTPFENMIAAGAYSDAEQELTELHALLAATEQQKTAERAAELLATAQTGMRAGEKALMAREAVLAGQYERVAGLCRQARELYTQIGDTHRDEELTIYEQRAVDVLALRQEMQTISQRALFSPNLLLDVPRLLQIGRELAVLGDRQGAAQANEAARRVIDVQSQRKTLVNLAILSLVLLLLGVRVRMAFRPLPLEAKIK